MLALLPTPPRCVSSARDVVLRTSDFRIFKARGWCWSPSEIIALVCLGLRLGGVKPRPAVRTASTASVCIRAKVAKQRRERQEIDERGGGERARALARDSESALWSSTVA